MVCDGRVQSLLNVKLLRNKMGLCGQINRVFLFKLFGMDDSVGVGNDETCRD
jgi:hypothetical protein